MPDNKRNIKYYCIHCDYTTQKKSNYMKHCNSKKHARVQAEKIKDEINEKEDEETIIDLKSELYDFKKSNKNLEEDNKRLNRENRRLYKEMCRFRKELNLRKAGLK